MKLTIDENSSNYPCTVVRIGKPHAIEGADKIQRVVLLGNNVIVSKAVQEGDLMLYFVAGTQISEAICHDSNLYDDPALNKDTTQKGYLSAKRRLVKALKLRGTVSDGMLLPLTSLPIEEGDLKEGDTFTHIDEVMICQKYEVPVRQSGLPKGEKTPKQNKLKDVIIDNQFRFHSDTAHFARNLEKFNSGTQFIVTRKYHGSSLILAHVLVNKKLNWFERLIDRFIPQKKTQYGFIYSSGKPKSRLPKGVEADQVGWKSHTPSYYSNDIWRRAYEMHKDNVEKGITLYGEIVGNGVQGADYTYGFDYEIFIYRITFTNEDGNVHELSWEAVKRYCEKYGLKYVDEYFVGKVREVVPPFTVGDVTMQDQLLDYLKTQYLDKSYPDCKVDEGVCIRLRDTDEIFKLKSPKFIEGESKQLEAGISDIETEN
jgi:RNA ligase (TIGR02306 family)